MKDFILQTANAPGVATLTLISPPTGRFSFASKFANGATAFYFLDDGVQYEAGIGTLTYGPPDTLSRNTVLSNSAGTTAKLNFAGTTRVFNTIPSTNAVWKDASGVLNAGLVALTEPGTGSQTLLISAPSSANGANIKLAGNGVSTPTKTIRVASGSLNVLNDAGTSILALSDTGALTASGVIQGPQITAAAASVGSTVLLTGDASHTGFVGLFNASGTRMGYVGFGAASSTLNLVAESTTTGWATTSAFAIGTSLSVGTTLSVGSNIAAGQNSSIVFTNSTALTLNQSGAVAATALAINLALSTSNFTVFQFGGTQVGSITTNGSATAFNTTSDYRLKTVHGQDDGSLLSKVPVYNAAWKHAPSERQPMILAHELQAIAPFAVTGTKDAVDDDGQPVMQQVDYNALVPALIGYVQSLERRLELLEAG